MQWIVAAAVLAAMFAAVYLSRERLRRHAEPIVRNTIIQRRARHRSPSVATSALFLPTAETDPDAIYRAARTALPASETRGFTGGGTFVAHEQGHLVLAKIRHGAHGELGEIVVSAEHIDGTNLARFTVASWQPRQGDLQSADLIESVRQQWLAAMYRWDKGGRLVWRDNKTLPKPGQSPALSIAHVEPQTETVSRREAVTIRRSTKQRCPSCSAHLPRGVGFCPQCGEDLVPQTRTTACVACGDVTSAQRNFCGRCGARIQGSPGA